MGVDVLLLIAILQFIPSKHWQFTTTLHVYTFIRNKKHGNNTLMSLFPVLHFLLPIRTDTCTNPCPLSPFFLFYFFSEHCILSLKLNSNQKNVKSGVTALSSTSSSFGTAAASTKFDNPTNGSIDESLKAQVLAEEEAAMNQYKVSMLMRLSL